MVEGDLFGETGGSNKIDFKAILLNYLQYWYVFLAGALVCLAVAFLHMRYNIIPQYYINATILIKDDKSGSGMGGSAALSDIDMFKSTKNIDNEIILLRSKSLMQRVLTELSYNTTYYKEGGYMMWRFSMAAFPLS
jgi:capsular polysaccharide biosynthesis protein